MRSAGRQAALDRQAVPTLSAVKDGYGGGERTLRAEVGRWDPGVELEAQWWVGGECWGERFGVVQGRGVEVGVEELFGRGRGRQRKMKVRLEVTGRKIGYMEEVRGSNSVVL